MPQCPHCRSTSVQPAPYRWADAVTALLLFRPFRCAKCGVRFLGFRLARQDGAASVKVDGVENRRAWVRFVLDREATCRPSNDESLCLWPTRIKDLSRGGARLVVNQAFEPGSLLNLQLESTGNRGHYSFLAEVVYSREQPDRKWAVGCRFKELLSQQVLDELIGKR